jgi:hypothetical protein
MTLSFFRASVSVRDLSTNRSTNSGIYVLQSSPPEHIPGFKCRATDGLQGNAEQKLHHLPATP